MAIQIEFEVTQRKPPDDSWYEVVPIVFGQRLPNQSALCHLEDIEAIKTNFRHIVERVEEAVNGESH